MHFKMMFNLRVEFEVVEYSKNSNITAVASPTEANMSVPTSF